MLAYWKKSKQNKSGQIIVDNIDVLIVRKKIKHLHLRVYPPDGQVRVSVPLHVCDEGVRLTVTERLQWIRAQQVRLAKLPAPTSYKIVTGECHYFRGKQYRLVVIEHSAKPKVVLHDNFEIWLYVRPDTTVEKRFSILNKWYRQQIKAVLPELITKWQPIIGVKVNEWAIKKMKTRWGTCNISASRIWLNLELMKKPIPCLEYVLVHEMVHLLERQHNKKFKAYMDKFVPNWRQQDEILKREPLVHDY